MTNDPENILTEGVGRTVAIHGYSGRGGKEDDMVAIHRWSLDGRRVASFPGHTGHTVRNVFRLCGLGMRLATGKLMAIHRWSMDGHGNYGYFGSGGKDGGSPGQQRG